jgi:aryl-alcohol dehydrogenase-like predicted oxidoreductase
LGLSYSKGFRSKRPWRSPNVLLIPGTSSVKHLRENLNAATLHIPSEMIADLDSIGGGAAQ